MTRRDNNPADNNPGENQPREENTPNTGKSYIKDETGKECWRIYKPVLLQQEY